MSAVINVQTGKNIISDIITSLEPRVSFIRSMRAIVDFIGTNTTTDSETALRTGFYLIHTMDNNALSDVKTYITNLLSNWRTVLRNNPRAITQGYYAGKLFVSSFEGAAIFLHNQFDTVLKVIEQEVNDYQFRFATGNDGYTASTKTISISNGADPYSSIITGPRLSTSGTIVGVCARYGNFTIDERIIHEILHYYHITLKRENPGDFFSLGIALIDNGFNPSYTGAFRNLWTHTEELKTISGLTVVGVILHYSRNSESRYLDDKKRMFRCSHSNAYCTKVPMYFVKVLQNTGLTIYYMPGEDIDVNYIKQHDDLI